MASEERPEVEFEVKVIAVTVRDYEESLALQREALEINRRNAAVYEDRAERACASNERIADALEALLELVRKDQDPFGEPGDVR